MSVARNRLSCFLHGRKAHFDKVLLHLHHCSRISGDALAPLAPRLLTTILLMIMMKKYLLLTAVACLGTTAFAQKGTKSIGLGLAYGTEAKNIGINVRGQYFVTDNVRLEASINNFFKHSGVSMWDLNANGAYVFKVSDKFRAYPMLGFAFTNWSASSEITGTDGKKYSVNSSHTFRFGANYGAGVEYTLTNNIAAFGEIREQVLPNSYSQGVFTLGIKANF